MKGLIGKKVGMTSIFDEKGNIVPVTVIEAGPNVVTQVRTQETDGYTAHQLSYGERKRRTLLQALKVTLQRRILRLRPKWLSFAILNSLKS